MRRSAFAGLLFAAVLIVALLMRADPAAATLFGASGPGCVIGDSLGEFACPGCGLTRSTALTMHGELSAAARVHAGGLLVVLACLAGLLLHGHVWLSGRRSPRHDAVLRVGRLLFAAGLVVAWLARLLTTV